MTIYTINIRGIKSKKSSLVDVLKEVQPEVISISGTHLENKEHLEIPGYYLVRHDRNNDEGGLFLAVKEQYKNITTEVSRTNDIEEALKIIIGSETKYRIGIIYVAKGDGE